MKNPKGNFFKSGICTDCKKEVRFYYRNGIKASRRCRECEYKRKQAKKEKKASIITVKQLDKLWGLRVRKTGYCEHCGAPANQPHHIFGRTNMSTRWFLPNGVELCYTCHTFGRKFSAHVTPTLFAEWVKKIRGKEWYEELRHTAQQTVQNDQSYRKEVLKYLNQ